MNEDRFTEEQKELIAEVRQGVKLFLSDDDFSKMLHNITDFSIEYFNQKEPVTALLFSLRIYFKHRMNGEFNSNVMILADFPPAPNSIPDRYDLMKTVGMDYFEKFVKDKPPGEKCYPIAVFSSMEGWARLDQSSGLKIKAIREGKEKIDFSKLSEKEEVILISGMTMDQRMNMANLKVTRTKENYMFVSKPFYIEFDPTEKNGMSSNLLNAFYIGFKKGLDNNQKEKL